jgi:hypothetical protein
MRFKIKTLLLAVVSVFALSGVAVASASAHEFHASKEAAIEGSGDGGQGFSIVSGAWTCQEAAITGKAKAGSLASLVETIKYGQCEGGGTGFKYTPVELEYSAGGTAKLLNTVTIEARSAKCTFTIAPAGNEALTSIRYTSNKSGTVTEEDEFHVQATSATTGAFCTKGEKLEIGFQGNLTLGETGGVLSWA